MSALSMYAELPSANRFTIHLCGTSQRVDARIAAIDDSEANRNVASLNERADHRLEIARRPLAESF